MTHRPGEGVVASHDLFGQTLPLLPRLRRDGVETNKLANRGALKGSAVVAASDRLSLLGRWAIMSSQFANKRGIYLGRRSARIHVGLYRRTDGRVGGHLPGLPAARMVLVDHIGAQSGVCRTSPLIYYEADGVVAVVASKAGQPTNPAWFHNLMAHPETTIQLGSDVRQVRARVASAEERDRLWPKLLAVYPGYDFFQDLAKGRKIPVVILGPRDGSRSQ